MTPLHPSILHINAKNLSESTIKIINKMTKEEKLYHGNTLEYWLENALSQYPITPISVLKYLTILELHVDDLTAENARLREALEAVRRHGLIEKDGYETVVKMVGEAITPSK